MTTPPNLHHLPRSPLAGERLALSADEVAVVLGISRAKAYDAIRSGELPSVRVGRRVLVPRRRLEELLHGPIAEPDPPSEPECTCGRSTPDRAQPAGTAG